MKSFTYKRGVTGCAAHAAAAHRHFGGMIRQQSFAQIQQIVHLALNCHSSNQQQARAGGGRHRRGSSVGSSVWIPRAASQSPAQLTLTQLTMTLLLSYLMSFTRQCLYPGSYTKSETLSKSHNLALYSLCAHLAHLGVWNVCVCSSWSSRSGRSGCLCRCCCCRCCCCRGL